MKDQELETLKPVEEKQYNTLNLGPTHPATHGIFQNVLKMDGEIIVDTEQTIGYIHRAFEKLGEHKPYYQFTTITDRMNYYTFHSAFVKINKCPFFVCKKDSPLSFFPNMLVHRLYQIVLQLPKVNTNIYPFDF